MIKLVDMGVKPQHNRLTKEETIYIFNQRAGRWLSLLGLYEGGSESSVIGVITLLIDMIGCCIIP